MVNAAALTLEYAEECPWRASQSSFLDPITRDLDMVAGIWGPGIGVANKPAGEACATGLGTTP